MLIKQSDGYVALISAIIVSAVLLIIVFSISFSVYFARFNILDSEYKKISTGLAEACVEAAMLELAQDPSYAGGENKDVGSNQCSILSIPPPSGGEYTIRTKAVFRNSVTNIVVVVNSTDFSVISWNEIPTL
ncbi:MAG: hypothetical protein HY397_01100 [Candidatus Doudnabacteria bacterium]|nr:hypothetical protein [Candidatus Doudnabacteria bacterium]